MLTLQVPEFKIRLTLITTFLCSVAVRSEVCNDPNILSGARKYRLVYKFAIKVCQKPRTVHVVHESLDGLHWAVEPNNF